MKRVGIGALALLGGAFGGNLGGMLLLRLWTGGFPLYDTIGGVLLSLVQAVAGAWIVEAICKFFDEQDLVPTIVLIIAVILSTLTVLLVGTRVYYIGDVGWQGLAMIAHSVVWIGAAVRAKRIPSSN